MSVALNASTELAYDVEGQGPPVLLIAGTSADRSIWGYVRPALNERYTTIAFDPRDAGRSSLTVSAATLEDLVADAVAVIDAAGFDRVHVIGHSMGGAVAQGLALSHPGRVRSLTLANSWARGDLYSRNAMGLARDLTRALADDALRTRALSFMSLGAGAMSGVSITDMAVSAVAAGAVPDREGVARQWDLDLVFDTLDRLREIDAPSHVLWSAGDRLVSPAQATELAGALRGSVNTRFDDGIGHLPMVEAPDRFTNAVLAFLATLPAD